MTAVLAREPGSSLLLHGGQSAPIGNPPELAKRLVPLRGAANFRDFGGYAAADGLRVRMGRLYRSNRLSELTDEDRNTLERLGVWTVYDLRARHERDADPTAWTHPSLDIRVFPPGEKRALVDMALDYPADEDGAIALMMDFYADLPRTMGPVFAAIVRGLSEGALPCIIHCSAGKDRTGVAAALVLAALGVDRPTIAADYAFTGLIPRPESDMARAVVHGRSAAFGSRYPANAVARMMAADPRYLDAALGAVEREHGSVEAYFAGLGVTAAAMARMREALLEDADKGE